MLASRYSGFVKSLLSSPKYSMRVLASCSIRDLRTTMSRTMKKISRECVCSLESLSSGLIKKNMKYFPVPRNEEWRTGILNELLSDELEIPGLTAEEKKEIKEYLCNS